MTASGGSSEAAILEAPPSKPRAPGMFVLRLLVALAIPVAAFAVLWRTFDFLRDENANRLLVVGVAIVVGVGGVFFLYWAMNRLVEMLPERYREGVRPYVFVGPALVILGVFCTAAAFVLFGRLIAEVGPGRAAVITYVAPMVAVALGVAVLGERPGAGAIAGLLLIIAGSWLATGGRLDRSALPPGLEDWSGRPFLDATGDPHRAQALWAAVHGMVVLELDGRFPTGTAPEATWRELVRHFS